ncbi:MAG TPA: hypothetical protein VNZ53_31195 [Steroidobacteraceae bacterium]|jgi:hypothetical protein|nr:hypothetical protein [Steroidobacteraceae bacterium]
MSRKPTKPDDSEQSKRFIETAEEVGADDEEALERAFKKIASKPAKAEQERS